MSALEQRYRSALRWYPAAWRDHNADAMVGTLLDVADGEGRTRPRASELANLALHGISARLGRIPTAMPAAVRDRAATGALAVGAAVSLTAIIQLESSPSRTLGWLSGDMVTFGPFTSPAIIVYAVWIAAFLVSVVGKATASRWLVASTIPLAIVTRVFADAAHMDLRPTATFSVLMAMLALLALIGSPATGTRGALWLVGWFVPALALFSIPQFLAGNHLAFQDPAWVEDPGALSVIPWAVVALAIALHLARQRSWADALLLVAAPFVLLAIQNGRSPENLIELVPPVLFVCALIAASLGVLRLFGVTIHVRRVPQR